MCVGAEVVQNVMVLIHSFVDEVHISVLLKACSLMKAKAPRYIRAIQRSFITRLGTHSHSLSLFLRPSFSESPLAEVLTQWTTLYEVRQPHTHTHTHPPPPLCMCLQSLAENLCQKHGLALADCLPPETPPPLEEDPAPTPLNITDDEKSEPENSLIAFYNG